MGNSCHVGGCWDVQPRKVPWLGAPRISFPLPPCLTPSTPPIRGRAVPKRKELRPAVPKRAHGFCHAQIAAKVGPQALLVWLHIKQILHLGLSRPHSCNVILLFLFSPKPGREIQRLLQKEKREWKPLWKLSNWMMLAQVPSLHGGIPHEWTGTSVPLFRIIHSSRGRY